MTYLVMTQENIDAALIAKEGGEDAAYTCPLAQAARQMFPNNCGIEVSDDITVYLTGGGGPRPAVHHFEFTSQMVELIENFDFGDTVVPDTFPLREVSE